MAVILTKQRKLAFKSARGDQLRTVFPEIEEPSPGVFTVPHDDDHLRVLRNMGGLFERMDPILTQYQFPRRFGRDEALPHMKETAAFIVANRRCYVLNEPRTMKTATCLMASMYEMETGQIKAMLVIAPLNAVNDWKRDLVSLFPNERPVILHGKDLRHPISGARFFFINYEGVKRVGKQLREAIDAGYIGRVFVDELTEMSKYTNDKWEAVNATIQGCPRVAGMTGTPGSPLQAHGQIRLITPERIAKAYGHWRRQVAHGPYGHKWILYDNAAATMRAAMQPAIRFERSQVFTLPTLQREDVKVPLHPTALRAYRDMKEEMQVVSDTGVKMTAVMAAATMSKLLQISAGVVIADDGSRVRFNVDERIEAVIDAYNKSMAKKIIIFTAFKSVQHMLVEELEKRGLKFGLINGDVAMNTRTQLISEFDYDPEVSGLVLHPRTASYSLELATADTTVYYGPPLNGTFNKEQCDGRILSMKQTSLCPAIINIYSTKAEQGVFAALASGTDYNRAIVNALTVTLKEN